MCEFIMNKIGLFSDALSNVKPRLKCPVMPGNYGLESPMYIDLSAITLMPVIFV